MAISERLAELGVTLPAVPAPMAAYIPAVRSGNLIFTSGQVPVRDGTIAFTGRLGAERTLEEGREAARICVINALAAAAEVAGGVDNIVRIVKVLGFVLSTPDFTQQPQVINGASEFLVELLGDAGRHARSAVGMSALPSGVTVELEMVVEVRP